jgi:hypothetical protein
MLIQRLRSRNPDFVGLADYRAISNLYRVPRSTTDFSDRAFLTVERLGLKGSDI